MSERKKPREKVHSRISCQTSLERMEIFCNSLKATSQCLIILAVLFYHESAHTHLEPFSNIYNIPGQGDLVSLDMAIRYGMKYPVLLFDLVHISITQFLNVWFLDSMFSATDYEFTVKKRGLLNHSQYAAPNDWHKGSTEKRLAQPRCHKFK